MLYILGKQFEILKKLQAKVDMDSQTWVFTLSLTGHFDQITCLYYNFRLQKSYYL